MALQVPPVTVHDLIRLLEDDPERLPPLLISALGAERGHDQDWLGFTSKEVRKGSPFLCNKLVAEGVFRIGYESRRYVQYRLAVPAAILEEALQLAALEAQPAAPGSDEIPTDLFDVIEGHEATKDRLLRAITATGPVHPLLVGVPGTAKSLFLEELARLPQTSGPWILGNSTRVGLTTLLREQSFRHLLVDEIDKGSRYDLSALLEVMNSGLITELKHGRRVRERRPIWVFSSCNSTRNLPPEYLSRCLPLTFAAYTPQEFRDVCRSVLVKREGADPEIAAEVAVVMAQTRSRDPRDAVKAWRLGHGDRQETLRLCRELYG